MMTTVVVVAAGVVGAVVASIVEHGLKSRRDNWKHHIAFALVGFAIASSVVDSILVVNRIDLFERRLDDEAGYMRTLSEFNSAAREVDAAKSPLVRSVFKSRIRNVNEELKTIVSS